MPQSSNKHVKSQQGNQYVKCKTAANVMQMLSCNVNKGKNSSFGWQKIILMVPKTGM